MRNNIRWQKLDTVEPLEYLCGYCGNSVAPEKGLNAWDLHQNNTVAQISICHRCTRPTFLYYGDQIPGPRKGGQVEGVHDENVLGLYNEARSALSAACPTATVLCCRKLLMHIAVDKDADQGLPFIRYVEYLSEKHYVPPDAKEWVDHIREAGNEANHEIVLASTESAEEVLSFCEMLLKLIYEFPSKIKDRKGR